MVQINQRGIIYKTDSHLKIGHTFIYGEVRRLVAEEDLYLQPFGYKPDENLENPTSVALSPTKIHN